jgi:hypothetical protein
MKKQVLFWVLFCFGLVLSTQAQTNLADNGDFEYGDLTSWGNYGPSAIQSDNVHAGSFALMCTPASGIWCSPFYELEPNTKYTCTAWVKCAEAGKVGSYLQVNGIGDGSSTKYKSDKASGTDWKQITLRFTTGATPTGVNLTVATDDDPATNSNTYIDDIVLTKDVVVENLADNGDFEYGDLTSWGNYGPSAIQSDNVHAGSYALMCTIASGIWCSPFYELEPNTAYTCTAWVKCAEAGKVGSYLQFSGIGDGSSAKIKSAKASSTDWMQITLKITTGATPTGVNLTVATDDNPAVDCSTYIDDIVLTKDPVVANLADNGDFEYGDLTSWGNYGPSAIQSDNVHAGSYALMCTAESGIWCSPFYELEPNTAYVATAWMKCAVAGQSGSYLQVNNIGDGSSNKIKSAKATSTDWMLITLKFTTGASPSGVNLTVATDYAPDCSTYIDDIILAKDINTGISTKEKIALKVYPNPVNRGELLSVPLNQDSKVVIYDLTGKKVFEKNCTKGTEQIAPDFVKGMYLIKVSSGKEQYSGKIIVK